MEDKFLQQLKKGSLELLVLELICEKPSYGYELLSQLRARSQGLFDLKEGTLYPILYRLEDDGLIRAAWSQAVGRAAPKKIYTATEAGEREQRHRRAVWDRFAGAVSDILQGGLDDEA